MYAVGKKIRVSKERLARAIAISLGITIYIKVHTDHLPALCGCAMAAAAGASAAITWLMNGEQRNIENSIKNVIGCLTGMIDDDKTGCGLRLSIAATAAVEGSLMAQRHLVVPISTGVIGDTIEQTIRNLGQVIHS
ncbi:MAG: protein yhaM [Pelosinus sp.]|nr:protein yhaM [Pelosinus sp.]